MDKQTVSRLVEQVLSEVRMPDITLQEAKELMEKVELQAKKMGVNAVIAVADASAKPIAVHCMDDAYIASYDIAVNKAYTSAALKMSTAQLAGLSGPGQPLYGIQNTNAGKIVIFGGGEPLKSKGRITGALGVSGGTLEEDTELAAYGRKIYEKQV